MKYNDIITSMVNLDRILRMRDEFIRASAERLISRLKSDDYGFPESDVCLQPIESPIDDSRSYHIRQLPGDYTDGRRGFRVRFMKHHNGYLCGVMCLAKWVFSVDGDNISAQIAGESESFEDVLAGDPSDAFINILATTTIKTFMDGICKMSQDPSVGRAMGFHSLNQS